MIITGQKRHTSATKRWMKSRNAVEPIIGHLKTEHRLKRFEWNGELGDAMFAVLAGAGFKKALRDLRLFCAQYFCTDRSVEIANWKTGTDESAPIHEIQSVAGNLKNQNQIILDRLIPVQAQIIENPKPRLR